MATETVPPPANGQTITGLVSGILGDAQALVKQQVAMVRAEIKADFRHTVQSTVLVAAGAFVMLPAVFLVCNVLVYALHEELGFTRWQSYGIVGAAFAVLGGVLIAVGVWRYRMINPLPDRSFEALKENVQWLTNPK